MGVYEGVMGIQDVKVGKRMDDIMDWRRRGGR